MGDFRIIIEATGGHGCQRNLGVGDTVGNCGQPGCPDCAARELVAKLQAQGQMVRSAQLIHWPGSDDQVTDDLLTGSRDKDFPDKPKQGDKGWEGTPPPQGGGPPH